MSRALEQALVAVALLRGDPSLDAEAWRLLREAVARERLSPWPLPSPPEQEDG